MNIRIISIFFISALVAYLLIWSILKTPLIELFRDKPGLRKVHQRVIPRIGGIAILGGFLLSVQIWHYCFSSFVQLPLNLFSALTFTALAITVVGLVDDMVIFEIHNRAKFLLEIIIAAEIVFINGIKLTNVHFLNWDFSLGWFGIPVTIIWIVGVTNAINIIDGIDGLAGSIMAVIFSTLAILTGLSGDSAIFFLSIILVGLVVGFLLHNISPARVFLGDTGSLFLGIITGILTIHLISRAQAPYPLIIAPLIVGLPILDVFVAMLRRFFKKLFGGVRLVNALSAMSVADNEHMHHRLIFKGLTHTETVIILVLFHAVICISAIMVKFTSNFQNIAMLIYIAVLGAWLLYKLQFFERFSILIEKHKYREESKRQVVAVVDASDVLRHSLHKYKQDTYSFSFLNTERVRNSHGEFDAAIIQQKSDSLEEVMELVNHIFKEKACPIIVITISDENLQMDLMNPVEGPGAFLVMKEPVYIPVLMIALRRLIRNIKGLDRVSEETKQFYLQATNEKI